MRCGSALSCSILALAGCTSVLGLDELEFDREPQTRSTDAGLRDALAHDVIAYDASEAERPALPFYPATWGATQVLVIACEAREGGPYYVYDRASGTLEAHRAVQGQFEIVGHFDFRAGFTHVISLPGAMDTVVGYDSATGLTEYAEVDIARQQLTAIRKAGSPGFTHFTGLPGARATLAYNRDSGLFRIAQLPFGEAGAPIVADWRAGFTHLVAMRLALANGEPETVVLKYDAASGDAELDRVLADAIEPIARGTLEAGFAGLFAYWKSEKSLLYAYQSRNGAVASESFLLAEGLALAVEEERFWRAGITHVSPLTLGGDGYAITHSAETGVADIHRLTPFEQPAVVR
jgi:hypothetical protein